MGGFVGWKTGVTAVVVLLAASANHFINKPSPLGPVVEISTGKVQGIVSYTRDGKEIHEYLGIPYAKDPIGDLRFAPPQPADPWTGVYDATKAGPQCMQVSLLTLNVEGSEECLHLNVYTPASRKGPLPVMVWIHGGGFVFGRASRYKPAYLLDEDVILVSPNYRLAALGFLNTGDGVVDGNAALKDQNAALRWVQQNIKHFGGDPKQVTIFGESAGSTSVGHHVLSPMSKGLFRRAIMQSGSPLASWLVNKDPAKQARQFADKMNCSEGRSTEEMVKCMRKLDGVTVVSAYKDLLFPLSDSTTLFVPTVESVKDANTFISEEPLELLKSGRFNKVPLITGVNQDEGTLISAVIGANQTKLQEANDKWDYYASRLLAYDTNRPDISDKLRKYYFGDVPNIGSNDLIDNFTNIFSDRHFFHPTHKFAKLYAKHAPTRMYYYTYSAQFSLSDILPSTQSERLPVVVSAIWELVKRFTMRRLGYDIPHLGICHGDEVQLIFSWPFRNILGEDARDVEMSKNMLKVWTDFVKNRDTLTFKEVTWPLINPKDPSPLRYLVLDLTPRIIDEPYTDRMMYWDSLGV